MWFPANSHPHAVRSTGLFGAVRGDVNHPWHTWLSIPSAQMTCSLFYAIAVALLSSWNVFHILLHPANAFSAIRVQLTCHLLLHVLSGISFQPPLESTLYFRKCFIISWLCLPSSIQWHSLQARSRLFIHSLCHSNNKLTGDSRANKGWVPVLKEWRS